MGRFTAEGINEIAELSLKQKLAWHLQGNHYPPIPEIMVKPCMEAIELANQGYWTAEVEMPVGTSYRGKTSAPVSAIVEQHHLETFLDTDYENEEY
jgi:hypothetical protein